jgi:PRTRC genetic system protein E
LFQELLPLLTGGRVLMLTVTHPDPQRLTVVVQPMALKESENPALSVPLAVTATPEQLDAELPAALRGFAAEHQSIAGALADTARRMKDAATVKENVKPGAAARSAVASRVAAPPPPPPVPTLWDTPAKGETLAAAPDAAAETEDEEALAEPAEPAEDAEALQEVA